MSSSFIKQGASMIVYLLLNQVNLKCYVGQHKGNTLTKRWNRTLNNAGNQHLTAAIRKYGSDKFKRIVLAHASCQDEVDLLEQFWIAALQTYNPAYGYNQQLGGLKGAARHTSETKQRIAESVRKAWRRKSTAEKAHHRLLARLQWLDENRLERMRENVSRALKEFWLHRSKSDRSLFSLQIALSQVGKRTGYAWNKGRKLGAYSREHRQRISEGLRRYWQRRKHQ